MYAPTVKSSFFFLFSSRRRHTRWNGDWSSDVCSSDLAGQRPRAATGPARAGAIRFGDAGRRGGSVRRRDGARGGRAGAGDLATDRRAQAAAVFGQRTQIPGEERAMNRHPSELALEAYLLDRETSPVAPHLGECERCRARVARMERDGGAPVSNQGALPGGAVLDGRPGLERFYAVCSPRPLRYDDLTKSVRAGVRGADDLRKGPALPGLPRGTKQATLLLEKRP